MFFIFSDNDLQIQVAKVFNNIDLFFFSRKTLLWRYFMCVCPWINVETEKSIMLIVLLV